MSRNTGKNIINPYYLFNKFNSIIEHGTLSTDVSISKNSNTQVVIVKNQNELTIFLKKNLVKDEIVIGMGAGLISQWMRELKFSL